MSFPLEIFEDLSRLMVEAALNGMWQGMVLAALVGCALRLAKKTNSATRHLVWFITLLLVSILPLLQFIRSSDRRVQKAYVTIISGEAGARGALPESAAEEASQPQPHLTYPNEPHAAEQPASASSAVTVARKNTATLYLWENTDLNAQTSKNVDDSRLPPPIIAMPELPSGCLLIVAEGWFALALFFSLRVWRSFLHLHTLKKNSHPLPGPYRRYFREALAESQCRKDVVARLTSAVSMPMAVGFSGATILLPESLIRQLTPEEFRHIMLHEIAHLLRRDDWTNFCAKVTKALFFFHPAIWWLDRQLTKEREMAADDFVLTITGQHRAYATCLTRLLELRMKAGSELLATGALLPRKQVFARIQKILDRNRDSSPHLLKRILLFPLGISLIFVQCTFLLPVLAFSKTDDGRGAANVTAQFRLLTLVPSVSDAAIHDDQSSALKQTEKGQQVNEEKAPRTDERKPVTAQSAQADSAFTDQESVAEPVQLIVAPPNEAIIWQAEDVGAQTVPIIGAPPNVLIPAKFVPVLMKATTSAAAQIYFLTPAFEAIETRPKVNILLPSSSGAFTQDGRTVEVNLKAALDDAQAKAWADLQQKLIELQKLQEEVQQAGAEAGRTAAEDQMRQLRQAEENYSRARKEALAAEERLREAGRQITDVRVRAMKRERFKLDNKQRRLREAQKKMHNHNRLTRPMP